MTNEDLVAAIRAGAGNRCALMEQLYKQNEGMIRKMANKAACGGDLFDDLMQEGYFALESAVSGFDPAAGVQFITSVPAYLQERISRYQNAKAALEQVQAEPVTAAQIAQAAGLTAAQAAETRLLLYQLRTVSLDAPLTDADDLTVGDLIPDGCDVAGVICDDAEREYNRRLLNDALQRDLDETEREILQRYFGGEQLRRVADDMGLIYQQAVRIQNKAIQKLRRDMHLRIDYMRSCDLYKYSYQRFKNSGLSSVEFIAERNERLHDGA